MPLGCMGVIRIGSIKNCFQVVGRASQSFIEIRSRWPLIIVAGVVGLLIAVVFPLIHAGRFGSGTDRADAYIVGLKAILNGSYPYYAHTPQGHKLTPMPGAFLLALVFYLMGNVSLQNIVWIFVFAWFLSQYYRSTIASLLYFVAYIMFSTVSIQDLITGGDYLVNIIYVAITFYWVALVHQQQESKLKRLAVAIIYAIALCSRTIFVLATLPVISAFVLLPTRKH